MPTYERIRYETTAQAIWITLARPEELNLVDDTLFDELCDAFVRARFDEDRSVVVLRGSGKMFSGGGNLKTYVAQGALTGGVDWQVEMYDHVYGEYRVLEAIQDCPKTTIVAINGDAYGAAVDIAMLFDLAIAVRGSKLMFAPGKWGLADTPNATRIVARIGATRAKDLLFTARRITAEEAVEIGLINRLCDRENFDEAVLQYVEDVLTTSPDARRYVKEVINRQLPSFSPREHYATAIGSDFKEGVKAFASKKPAPWTAEALAHKAVQPSPTPLDDGSPNGAQAHAAATPPRAPGRYRPRTWRLGQLSAADGPEPTAVDPQTSGDLWQIWTVTRTDDIDVLYGHVEKGNRTGAHTHPDANHYTCVVKGTALVWMEGTIVEVQKGDVINIPSGVLHDFGSTNETDVWVVDMTSPPFDPEKMQFHPERDAEISAAFDQALAQATASAATPAHS